MWLEQPYKNHLGPSFEWKLVAFLEEQISEMAVAEHGTECCCVALPEVAVALILKCCLCSGLEIGLVVLFGCFFFSWLFKYWKL